jgi:hypothetical protein
MASVIKSVVSTPIFKQLGLELRIVMSMAIERGLDQGDAIDILTKMGYSLPEPPEIPMEEDIMCEEEPVEEIVTRRKDLFSTISSAISRDIGPEFIKSTKTTNGDTQVSERNVIGKIREVLTDMGLVFNEAGSQQSKDFRNVGGIGLDIEVKKTDSTTIYFNDTCPNKNIWYVILFTGKEYKLTPEKNIPPQLLYLNGEEFIHDSPWIEDYVREINLLKDKYARGEGKKSLSGIMEVYPRPTFKANISGFLTK